MGAMIATGVGARTDDELRALFDDPSPLRTDALRMLPPGEALRLRSVYDPAQLLDVILHNNGDLTFAEAFAHTGRIVNVSVSPTRERQKPRLLCYLNAPHVLMSSAALASSAVPGAFPPAVLKQRDPTGTTTPYMGTETWIDGTFNGDVPKNRMARLHGVNHFIVSQVNPHVAPLGRLRQRRGMVPFVVDAAVSSFQARAAADLRLARRFLAPTPLSGPVGLVHSLVDQSYGGDIDIHPSVRIRALLRTFANISHDELRRHILEGERATWPLIARVRDQTRVERALAAAINTLQRPKAS
jgi:NTE family protein